MIQPLPFVDKDNIKYIVDNIDKNQKSISSERWADLPKRFFTYARVMEEYRVKIECNCSREMFFGIGK